MERLAEIEAELRARWDRETLEVYADALQADGDPRGALIALAISGKPSSPALRRERDQLEAAWLGGFQLASPSWIYAHTGFVTAYFRTLADVTSFLASHLAAFLRRIEVWADRAECAAALDALASRLHAWCTELTIGFGGFSRDAVPIPTAIVERIAEAMPRLATLHLHGWRLLDAPLPSQIEKLVLHSPRALVGRLPMPAVAELVLPHLHIHEQRGEVLDLLHPHIVPGLSRLDLSDNEGHIGDALAVVEHLEAIERLSWLQLPSLRGEGEVRSVRALLDRVPGLTIEIARSHRPLAHLLPPGDTRLRVPDPVPCAPHDSFEGGDSLVVSVPGCAPPFEFLTGTLAYNTETYYTSFSSEQQAALTVLWDRIPALGATPIGFPAPAMAQIVETMMLTDCDAQIGIAPWEELGRALRGSPCAVLISRRR